MARFADNSLTLPSPRSTFNFFTTLYLRSMRVILQGVHGVCVCVCLLHRRPHHARFRRAERDFEPEDLFSGFRLQSVFHFQVGVYGTPTYKFTSSHSFLTEAWVSFGVPLFAARAVNA